QGGGCSGFQYGFEFDENQAEDDMAVATDGVTLLVDPLSLQYLMGAEVDYSEGLSGAQFVIRNPNAKTPCGCGSSFSVCAGRRACRWPRPPRPCCPDTPSAMPGWTGPMRCAAMPPRSPGFGRTRVSCCWMPTAAPPPMPTASRCGGPARS